MLSERERKESLTHFYAVIFRFATRRASVSTLLELDYAHCHLNCLGWDSGFDLHWLRATISNVTVVY